MPIPYDIRNARGPKYSGSYHTFCPTCHRVIYNLYQHGPVTPHDFNKTFCVCDGEQTGEVYQRVTIYDLEDVLSPEDAAKERTRQERERKKLEDNS